MPTNAKPKARSAPRRRSAEFVSMGTSATAPVPFPLVLQRRASQTVRKHALRSVVRVASLVTADVATLLVVRALLHGISDARWLGSTAAGIARLLAPPGTYPIAQLSTAVVLGLLLLGNYRSGDHRQDARTLGLGATLGVSTTVWASLWQHFSLSMAVGAAVAAAVLSAALLCNRLVVDAIVRRVRLSRGHPMRALVVGTRADAERAMANAALSDPTEFQMVGFVDTAPTPCPGALGGVRDVVEVLSQWKIDTLVLAGSFEDRHRTHLVHVADAAGCQVLTLPGTLLLEGFAPRLVWRRGVPLVAITRPGLRGHHLVLKRLLDLAVSATALVLLSPLLLTVAAAVKATSRGPVLFRQVRVGRGGRHFRIAKFRSMCVDAEARLEKLKHDSVYGDGRLFKMERDPRITPIGAFLRRTSLDELPQLWNVLVGDMSLVGPRPPIPSEVQLYDDHHYSRFDVKPGITGPWQVSGRNKIRDFEEVVRLEMSYIRQWSIGKDLSILLRTVPAVLKMDGAY